MNEFDTAVKAYISQPGGRAQLDEMLDDWRDGIKQDDESNADDNRKIGMLKPVRSLKSKYKRLPLEKRMLVNLGGIGLIGGLL